MNIKDIPRVSLCVKEWEPSCYELGKEAKTLLGYEALEKFQTMGADVGQLARILIQLGISTLDVTSVKHYQMKLVHEAEKSMLPEFLRTEIRWRSWRSLPEATWSKVELKDYKKPIPEFVLNKAISIKKADGNVQFFVEELVEGTLDPFLIAKLLEEEYYIEVWEEPKFEGRLEAI